MRGICMGIAGVALTFALAGCSETVDEGPVGFKGSQSPTIEALQKSMSENVKNKDHLKKPAAESKPGEAKPTEPKPTETKPAAEKK